MSINDDEIIIEDRTEERYFSRSKNHWMYVSDMTDVHVRRAFKRLLRMIRLNQLVEVEDVAKNTIYQVKITEELNKIKAHCDEIRRVVDE